MSNSFSFTAKHTLWPVMKDFTGKLLSANEILLGKNEEICWKQTFLRNLFLLSITNELIIQQSRMHSVQFDVDLSKYILTWSCGVVHIAFIRLVHINVVIFFYGHTFYVIHWRSTMRQSNLLLNAQRVPGRTSAPRGKYGQLIRVLCMCDAE